MPHLPILLCAASIFLLGGLWYSPALFGTAWGKANGPRASEASEKGAKHPAQVYGVAFVMAWLAAYAFAALLGTDSGLHHAIHLGLLCGVGIAGSSFAINYQFADRPTTLLLIDGGYHIVQFLLYAVILALWPW